MAVFHDYIGWVTQNSEVDQSAFSFLGINLHQRGDPGRLAIIDGMDGMGGNVCPQELEHQ